MGTLRFTLRISNIGDTYWNTRGYGGGGGGKGDFENISGFKISVAKILNGLMVFFLVATN